MRNPKRPKYSGVPEQKKMVRSIAELEVYDQLAAELLPSLVKDLAKGLSHKEILEKHAPLAAASMVALLAKADAPTAVLQSAKDILDRVAGKAAEKKEHTHKFANLTDQEIDAVLLTEVDDLANATEPDDAPESEDEAQ